MARRTRTIPGRQVGPHHRRRPRHRCRAGPQGRRPGCRVALVGLEPELLAAVADELGPEHLWVEADVTDADALKAAVQRTVDTFGGLDVAVANAGIAPLTTVSTAPAEALSRTIEVNLIGVDADRARGAARGGQAPRAHPADQLGGRLHRAAGDERLLRRQGRARAVR